MSKPKHFRRTNQCYFCKYLNDGKGVIVDQDRCTKHQFDLTPFETENFVCDDFEEGEME